MDHCHRAGGFSKPSYFGLHLPGVPAPVRISRGALPELASQVGVELCAAGESADSVRLGPSSNADGEKIWIPSQPI